jgi:superfamily I DNA and/or RNA helicase
MSARHRKKLNSIESDQHFIQMMEWLAMESQAEVARMAERRQRMNSAAAEKGGETILDLAMVDHQNGLGGRNLFSFKRRDINKPMPWHRLRVGSPVVVSDFHDAAGQSVAGVVSSRSKDGIQVAVDHWLDGDCFRIDLAADEVTRQRQLAAIGAARDSRGRVGQLREVMMGEKQPRFAEALPDVQFHADLNLSQQEAVRFALAAEDMAVIHGPPGTGKTTTVVELIVQAIERGQSVLACGPSNTAVDNLLEKLVAAKQKVVRIGHPARVAERLREYTLDGLVEQHENQSVIRDLYREAEQMFRRAAKWTRSKRARGERQEMRREANELKQHARLMEQQAIDSTLNRAQVICATTTFNENLLGERWFDLVVIDEACQSVEPGCWQPILRCDKVVMAGDPMQLPPTVLSSEAARQGFALSLLERQLNIYGDQVTRLLNVQYRMHQQIMTFSSDHFYAGQLIADESVAKHQLHDLPSVEENELTREPVTFIDTAGAGWDEEIEPEGLSKLNPQEAALVVKKVAAMAEVGVPSEDIAVIAPYAAQVRLIRQLLAESLDGGEPEVDTVDGFQGREKEVVVISLVRSNSEGEIGFLSDERRMNVALTRARRKLIVIGDSATLGGHEFYQSLLEYFEELGVYHTVWEES